VGSILKLLFFVTSSLFFVAVVVIALTVFLVVTGSPSTCGTPGWTAYPTPLLATELNARWAVFSAQSQAGPASIQITDAEATARGRQYLDDEDVPVNDFRVLFCGDGKGQLAGTVGALGLDTKFVVTGHLDIGGDKPVVALDSVHVGNVPGFIADKVLDILVKNDKRTLELDENLSGSQISDGLIVISGGP
jgi:hypothetical protein